MTAEGASPGPPTEAHGPPGGRWPAMDGLRAIGCLQVILTHLAVFRPLPGFIRPLVGGQTPVYMFFAMSGFLITGLLLDRVAKHGDFSVRDFYARRMIRIVPGYLAFLATVLVLMLGGAIGPFWTHFALAAVYLSNIVPRRLGGDEIAHTWSLSVEEHFYLFWPWLFRAIHPYKKPAVAIMVASTFGAYVFIALLKARWPWLQAVWALQDFTIPAGLLPLLGCAFAMVDRLPDWRGLVTRFEESWAFWPLNLAVYAGTAFLPRELDAFEIPGRTLAIMFMVHFVVHRPAHVVTRFLEIRPLVALGTISYGVYLWQGLFLRIGPDGYHWWQQFPASPVLAILCAVISWNLVEKPTQRLRAAFTR